MKPINEALRGTGRTTEIINQAEKLVKQGKNVTVVFAKRAHAETAQNLCDDRRNGVACIGMRQSDWSWEAGKQRGYSDEQIYLVDHYAFEEFAYAQFDKNKGLEKELEYAREVIQKLEAKLKQINQISNQ